MTSVDADLLKRQDDTSLSGRTKTIVEGISTLFDASVLQLAQDNRDLENGVLLATRDGTLLGQTSTASALGGLVAPLENQIYAFSDNTQASEKAVIAGQIATLTAEINSLQSQRPSGKPTRRGHQPEKQRNHSVEHADRAARTDRRANHEPEQPDRLR